MVQGYCSINPWETVKVGIIKNSSLEGMPEDGLHLSELGHEISSTINLNCQDITGPLFLMWKH